MPITNASHIALRVSDLDRSVGFYRDVMGLEVLTKMPSIRRDGEKPIRRMMVGVGGFAMEIVEVPDAFVAGERDPLAEPGFVCLAFRTTDINADHERLQTAGARVMTPPTLRPHGARIMVFQDPDGNLFEFIEFAGELTSASEYVASAARA